MAKSVAEIFAARSGQRLRLNACVAGFADFDSWEGRDGGMDGRRERGLEILNWNGDFEGEGCRLRI